MEDEMAEDNQPQTNQDQAQQTQTEHQNKPTEGSTQSIDDVKGIAAVAYILFFVPLITNPDDDYAKFHANQGLLLLITGVAVNMLWIIPILGWIAAFFGSIFVFVLWVMGIMNALNGEMKRLPLIGHYDILK